MKAYEKKTNVLLHTFKPFEKKELIKHMLISAQDLYGDFSFDYNYGVRNGQQDSVDQNTPFMIASVTKLFIASTILRLHELGKLDIHDPISKYLDSELLEGIHVYKGEQRHHLITIRHLLSHTSGILDYIQIKDQNKQTIFDRVIQQGDVSFSITDMLAIVKKAKGSYFDVQPIDRKKKKARYSDTNFQLLRAIIENVTDSQYEEALNKYIFQPLHMDDTFLPSPEDKKPYSDVASLWVMDEEIKRPLALRSFGDYYSTKNDLFRFMRGLLKGELFQKQETLDFMMKDFQTFSLSFSPVAPAWPIAYSMGMIRFDMPLLFTGFKRMPTVYGHTGVGSAFLFYVPDLELILCGTVGQVRYTALPFQVIPKMLIKIQKITKQK